MVDPRREDSRSDEELMAALCEGDRDALRVLHQRHAPWVVVRLSRRCADPGLVDEAVQDAFCAIWRRPESYRAAGSVPA